MRANKLKGYMGSIALRGTSREDAFVATPTKGEESAAMLCRCGPGVAEPQRSEIKHH